MTRRYKPAHRLSVGVDLERCRAAVSGNLIGGEHQCYNRPKEGSEWCGIHDPKSVERRSKAQQERWNKRVKALREKKEGAVDRACYELLKDVLDKFEMMPDVVFGKWLGDEIRKRQESLGVIGDDPTVNSSLIRIAETSTSTWSYHLVQATSEDLKQGQLKALCGKEFVGWETSLPMRTWGEPSHIPSHWCVECDKAFDKKTGK